MTIRRRTPTHVSQRYLADSPSQQFRFQAAEIARRDGVMVPSYATGDDAIKRDRDLMVRLNRDLFMNNAPYRAIINGMVGAVVGTDGVEFCPTADKETKDVLTSLWLDWTKYADFTRRQSFTGMERQIFTELLVVGEVLLVKRKSLKLQIVESERIKEVTTNDNGEITSVSVYDPNAKSGSVTISSENFIYLSLTERPSQVRGAGILWCCADIVSMLSYVLRKSARAWGMAANYAIAVEADSAPAWGEKMAEASTTDPETGETYETDDPLEGRSFSMEDCQIFLGRKGEKISTVSHNGIPNVQLGEHVLTYLRIISSVIGCDAATFVLSDYSKVNYSSSRAANVSLSKVVSRFQNQLGYTFYDRVGRWLIGSWGAMGIISNSEELLDTIAWIYPKPPIIDAKGEAQAAELELSLGLTTHNDLLLARNIDPSVYLAQRKQEILDAINTANEIKQETGVDVKWECLIGFPYSVTSSKEETKPEEKEND